MNPLNDKKENLNMQIDLFNGPMDGSTIKAAVICKDMETVQHSQMESLTILYEPDLTGGRVAQS
jgi:hypothetical protein